MDQHDEPAGALEQRPDLGGVAAAEQVAFPVAVGRPTSTISREVWPNGDRWTYRA